MSTHTAWYYAARSVMERWKQSTSSLPLAARQLGTCFVEKGRRQVELGPFPFCLPKRFAEYNLLTPIRARTIRRFDDRDIAWHMWTPGPGPIELPSTHLLSSQVQCANVLLSMAEQPAQLLSLVRSLEPHAEELITIEDESVVALEWIGLRDYLGESRGRKRRRGKLVTSADGLIVATRRDGGRTALVLEWKFTESGDEVISFHGEGGTDRREVYRAAYLASSSPFAAHPDIDSYFLDAHYQLLRLALLAAAMVAAREFGIDRAILVQAIPSKNVAFRAMVPAGLRPFGRDLESVWSRLLPGPTVRYVCLASEPLVSVTPDLAERYGALSN